MHRKKFGKLVTVLRREHLEKQKPWSRLRFSEECKIDEEILSNIENGRKTVLPPDLLLNMADGLKLTSGERKEFFLAATGIDEQKIYHPLDTPQLALEQMLTLMDKLQQPAFLVDQYFDIVAVNLMVLEVYNVNVNDFLNPAADAVTRFSLIRFLFSSEFAEQKSMLGKHQENFMANTVMLFRAASLRYRAGEYFQHLYSHLNAFDDFKKFTQTMPKDEHYVDNNMYIMLDNPRLGAMNCISSSVAAATTAGELKLFIFTPLNEETARIFGKLARQGNYVFHSLPDWPNKDILNGK
jgi:hypothetical protein